MTTLPEQPAPEHVLSVVGADAVWSAAHGGLSGTPLWRTTGGNGSFFVKYGGVALLEQQRLNWLSGRMPVPAIHALHADGEASWLVIADVGAASAAESADPLAAATAMGETLRRLHGLAVADCPFQAGTPDLLRAAQDRLDAGLFDGADFDDDNAGRAPTELFAELLRRTPRTEDLVVTHGDFTPPNLLLPRDGEPVLIDVAGLGVADRYRDLALAHRDLLDEHGQQAVDAFRSAYGLSEVDHERLYWYRLLDEFY